MRFVPQQNEGARLLCMWCVLVTSDACCLLLTEEIASKKIQRPIDSVQVKFGQVHCHFWSWSQSLVFCQVFLYEQRAAYCCNHFWFAICTSGTILRLTVARRPHSSATANLVRQNQSHRWRIQITRYSWIATSMILRAGCFRDFESEQEYEWNHESNLDSLLQEHGVESQINKQIRTCRFAGLHGDASTPYVACEATTTAADPVRRTTQPATCVRIPGDFFFKRWSTLCLDTWGRCVFFPSYSVILLIWLIIIMVVIVYIWYLIILIILMICSIISIFLFVIILCPFWHTSYTVHVCCCEMKHHDKKWEYNHC